MADEDEWKKLPTDQKVGHKAWKARAEGYKECIKLFPTLEDKSGDFSRYLGLIKKFVVDTNELNRIQGVEAANLFVQNAHVAGKTVNEVVSGVVLKCLNSKPKLKETGMSLCLNYIEIDKQEQVMEELVKGFDNKQPKIVNSCVETVTKALSEFGSSVIKVSLLMKPSKKLVDHRDKIVRESTKQMLIEIYRWIKDAIRLPLQSINAVVLKELEGEWEKMSGDPLKQQTRFMRSQQSLRDKYESKQQQDNNGDGGDVDAAGDAGEPVVEIDPYELVDPVEILSKLPKDFYDKIEAKKWQERKEMLVIVEKLAENPKLVPGDYADLLKTLKKVVAKDTNILLVAIAIKCIGGIALGLRKKFQPYAMLCLETLFERFKEKKASVIQALKDATDAVADTIPLTNLQESLVEYLAHKNPSVRAQIGYFLGRTLLKMKAVQINKALLKSFITPLLKNLDHGTPDVREGAYVAIGTCMMKIGENKILPFIADVDKIKVDKIRESAGKLKPGDGKEPAAASTKETAVKKPAAAAPVKKGIPAKKSSSTNVAKSKKVVKGGGSGGAAKSSAAAKKVETFDETELGDDDVEAKIDVIFNGEMKGQILNTNWKERFAGLQAAHNKLKILDSEQIPAQAIVKFLANNKPGLKDSNFNCLNEKFNIIKYAAENSYFSMKAVEACMTSLIDKSGDIKCGNAAKDALTSMCEATSFALLSKQIIEYAMGQKNPKVQSESLKWFSIGLIEFGIEGVDIKLAIKHSKSALAATNIAVRKSSLLIIRSLAIFLGEMIMNFFSDEKAALLTQIKQEVDQVRDEPKPKPIRGKKKAGSSSSAAGGGDGSEDDGGDDDDDDGGATKLKLDDLVTRVNISGKMTEDLMKKLSDPKWKERKEALANLVEILKEAKFVEPSLGDLPIELKKRFKDSNKLLLITTLEILTQLAECLGKHCTQHLSTFIEGIITSLADSKPKVRQSAIECMDKWYEHTKLGNWFANDEISTCLSIPKYTFLRTELLKWLTDKLMTSSVKSLQQVRENIEMCVRHVYQCCEDRNSDVRSKAVEILPALILHLSYKKMVQLTSKLPASSKNTVAQMLESANEKVPKPTAAKPSVSASNATASKTVKRPATTSKSATTTTQQQQQVEKKPTPAAASSKAGGDVPQQQKKETKNDKLNMKKSSTSSKLSGGKTAVEELCNLFIPQKNGKELRYKEERTLKVLKWAFTAPRDELVQQLRQQMTLCVNPTVLADMFHTDPQKHRKIIAQLNQALTSEWKETVDNLDVLLRWFTLRFYDNNTTIHLKSFEYLNSVLTKFKCENDGRLNDYEAIGFIPHLIIKIGDSKDSIRKHVSDIMDLLMDTYDEKKIYQQAMLGTKSKNAKQRTGCLDVIGRLIKRCQTQVCDPTLPKACKDIAAFISDRDKTVRDAALNTIVTVYEDVGEITYKYVGRLSDKDMGMLEERIKRSARPATSTTSSKQQEKPPPPSSASGSGRSGVAGSKLGKSSSKMSMSETSSKSAAASSVTSETSATPPTDDNREAPPPQPTPSGFPNEIQNLLDQIQDLDKEYEKPIEPIPTYNVPDWLKDEEISPNAKETLDLVISRLVNPDNNICLKAIHELTLQANQLLAAFIGVSSKKAEEGDGESGKMFEIVKRTNEQRKYEFLKEQINQLINAATMKFKMMKERALPDVTSSRSQPEARSDFVKICQSYLSVITMIFTSKELLQQVSSYVLFDFLRSVIPFMVDERLLMLENGHKFIQSINAAVFDMVNNTDAMLLSCATVKLVKEAISEAPFLRAFIDKGDKNGARTKLDYYSIAMKCHVKIMKRLINTFPEHNDELLADLLLEIEDFWEQYPPGHNYTTTFAESWKLMHRGSSTKQDSFIDKNFMLKTLKTSLVAICDQKQADMIRHLYLLGESQYKGESPVLRLICGRMKIGMAELKSRIEICKQKDARSGRGGEKTVASVEGKLAEIFKKLGKEECLEEAMTELYEFTQDHPSYDIQPTIDGLELNCFKNYIRTNLKQMSVERNENIDVKRKREMMCENVMQTYTSTNSLNDINQLRACCGLGPLQEDKIQQKQDQEGNSNEQEQKILKTQNSQVNSKLQPKQGGGNVTSSVNTSASSRSMLKKPTSAAKDNFVELRRRYQELKKNNQNN